MTLTVECEERAGSTTEPDVREEDDEDEEDEGFEADSFATLSVPVPLTALRCSASFISMSTCTFDLVVTAGVRCRSDGEVCMAPCIRLPRVNDSSSQKP